MSKMDLRRDRSISLSLAMNLLQYKSLYRVPTLYFFQTSR